MLRKKSANPDKFFGAQIKKDRLVQDAVVYTWIHRNVVCTFQIKIQFN